jgi:hypothetical protein
MKATKPEPEVVGKICEHLAARLGAALRSDRRVIAKLIAEHDAEKDAEIERLRAVVHDCRKAIRQLDTDSHSEQSWAGFCKDTARLVDGTPKAAETAMKGKQ